MTRRWMLAALILLVTGCIEDGRPASCDGPAQIALVVTGDSMTPADPSVCRDQAVTLSIESEVDGVLHIHGYDEEAPATPIVAGETLELSFTASRSGQFPMELHADDDPAGVELGIFTVHEP